MLSGYSVGSLKLSSSVFVFVAAGLILSSLFALSRLDSQAVFVRATETSGRAAVYASDPNDAWNRIFFCLFTHTVKARLSSSFDEGAPFARIQYGMFPHTLSVSTRLFERAEIGDRAVEPLYPSFFTNDGATQVLSEPLYSQLRQALNDALEEKAARPTLDRALMQSDAWAAYDLLYRKSYFTGADSRQLQEHRGQLLPLLARFVKKLALTRNEIDALPDNYGAAARSYNLPGLFVQGSGWLEVQWRPEREHDRSADYRRATRIFIKPTSTPPDKQEFLDGLRSAPDVASKLDAVALVTQNLLIDRDGEVLPSRLTYDVQLRRFFKNERGALVKTEVEEYELSRRLLLSKPTSGGLVGLFEKAPAYLPVAGNDYGFASTQLGRRGGDPPILATLRSRCVACHAQDVATVFTFSTSLPPPFSSVAQLNPSSNEHAFYVARRKTEREDFRALSEQDAAR